MPYAAPNPLPVQGGTRPIPVIEFIADTLAPAVGAQTAPVAGTTIATITPAAGTYSVVVTYGFGATADVVNNFKLLVGASVFNLVNVAAINSLQSATFVLTLDGATALTLQNISAGGVGSVFLGQIVCTRIR